MERVIIHTAETPHVPYGTMGGPPPTHSFQPPPRQESPEVCNPAQPAPSHVILANASLLQHCDVPHSGSISHPWACGGAQQGGLQQAKIIKPVPKPLGFGQPISLAQKTGQQESLDGVMQANPLSAPSHAVVPGVVDPALQVRSRSAHATPLRGRPQESIPAALHGVYQSVPAHTAKPGAVTGGVDSPLQIGATVMAKCLPKPDNDCSCGVVRQSATQNLPPRTDNAVTEDGIPVSYLVERGTLVCIPKWVGGETRQKRKTDLGLDNDPSLLAFCQHCEFVSLGNYCGVAFALQALGLKRFSYPFDWVRSPAAGVIKCVRTNFADFLSHTFVKDQTGYPIQMFGGSAWGGSFWHHRIQEDKCREEFARRISRFYSHRAEVPTSMPRVFVRALNSSQEISASLDLYHALRAALPGTQVYLLVLIDLQKTQGLIHVNSNAGMGLLFYRIHERLYADRGVNHEERMRMNGEAYAAAIADAIRVWAGKAGQTLVRMPSLEHLEMACEPFDGGCPSSSKYSPRSLGAASTAPSVAKTRRSVSPLHKTRESHQVCESVVMPFSSASAIHKPVENHQVCESLVKSIRSTSPIHKAREIGVSLGPSIHAGSCKTVGFKQSESNISDISIGASTSRPHPIRRTPHRQDEGREQLKVTGSYVSDISTTASSLESFVPSAPIPYPGQSRLDRSQRASATEHNVA